MASSKHSNRKGRGKWGKGRHAKAQASAAKSGQASQPQRDKGLEGVISISRRGYGFVTTPRGEFFVPRGKTGGAMPGDTVALQPVKGPRRGANAGKGPRAEVVKVLERATDEIVGRYERSSGLGIITALDQRVTFDVFCDASRFPHAKTGDYVVARIDEYPTRSTSAQGSIVEVLGREGDRDVENDVLLRSHGFAVGFSQAVRDEAEALTLDVDAALAQPLRRDLRGLRVLTIDPVDARDFDDALSLEEVDGKTHLGVHIADVSEYVPWNSAVDAEARRRTTSVYLVGRSEPMLPEALSAGLCSLAPGEERLAMTVDVTLDSDGMPEGWELYPSVIRSGLRLDYGRVQRMLDGDEAFASFDDDTSAEPVLKRLAALARRLRDRRVSQGAIDLESPEATVILDEAGDPVDVQVRATTPSTSLVEECMLLANRIVATELVANRVPAIFRVHERPAPESLDALLPMLKALDYPLLGFGEGEPAAIQAVLDRARTREERDLVHSSVLRAMKRAIYQAQPAPHFGLAFDRYCHFTSPIRRYPDLVVHRMLKAHLAGEAPNDEMVEALGALAQTSSARERAADDASRESTNRMLCRYLAAHLGEVFGGCVTGVATGSIGVRLDITAEGVVPFSSLDEWFDKVNAPIDTLVGETTGRIIRAGQRVHVRVEDVRIQTTQVAFSLIGSDTDR